MTVLYNIQGLIVVDDGGDNDADGCLWWLMIFDGSLMITMNKII